MTEETQVQKQEAPESLVGQVIADRYQILEVLGQGGIGVVYKAKHTLMDRIVAFKMLKKETLADERSVQRFQQEAKAMCSLNHPNVVSVFDFGVTSSGSAFLVMDFLDGIDLDSLVQENGYLEPDEVVCIFVQICDALTHAHSHGIIHRDIKPGNVIILNPGTNAQVKLVDFGMAKFQPREGREMQALTRPGEVFGSPYYMSPEQCTGMELDLRSDLYSTGCVMYEALTGRPPFLGNNMVQMAEMHIKTEPTSIAELIEDPNFPPWLDKIVIKSLAKNVNERYQSAAEMKQALIAFKKGWLQRTTSRLVFKTPTGEFGASASEAAVISAAPGLGGSQAGPGSQANPGVQQSAGSQASKSGSRSLKTGEAFIPASRKESIASAAESAWTSAASAPPAVGESDNERANQGKRWQVHQASTLGRFFALASIVLIVIGSYFFGKATSSLSEWQELDQQGNKALSEGKFSEAEYDFNQAARLAEAQGEKNNPDLYRSLANLATVYQKERKYEMAESIFTTTIEKIEKTDGMNSPSLAPVLVKLARLYNEMNKLDAAEAVHKRAIDIVQSAFGHDNAQMAECLTDYAHTKRKQGDHKKADELQLHAQTIKASQDPASDSKGAH